MVRLVVVKDDQVAAVVEIDPVRAIALAGDLIAAASPHLEQRPG
jgi:hypothetical protein